MWFQDSLKNFLNIQELIQQDNLNFYILIMKQMRDEILRDDFKSWSTEFLKIYEKN